MSEATSAHASGSERAKAFVVLLAAACVIGFAPVCVRLSEVGPSAAGFWRLVFALPLLMALAQRTGEGVARPSRMDVVVGLAFALDLGFWHYGIDLTSVAKATVLSNLTPVVVTAIGWVFFRQRPSPLFLVAVGLAVAGSWIMAVSHGEGSLGRNPPLGDAVSTITAVWYALYFLALGRARRSESASRIMFWSAMVGAPVLLLAAALLREQLAPATWAGWAWLIGLGVIHVAGQGSIAWALGRLPAAVASVIVLIQPAVTGVLGWLLFNEIFGPGQMFGGVVALCGVILAQWASRNRPAATPAQASP